MKSTSPTSVISDKTFRNLLLIACVIVSLATGLLVASGSLLGLFLLLGAIAGIWLISKPYLAVWVVILGGTIVSGIAELYLPNIQKVRIGFSLLSVTLIVLSGIKLLMNNRLQSTKRMPPVAMSVVYIMFGFVACALLTTLMYPSMWLQSVNAIKNYYQLYGVLAVIAIYHYPPKDATKFIKYLWVLALIQIPFALHEFFVFVPLLSTDFYAFKGVVAVDVVTGTFGGTAPSGNDPGGTRSASFALLMAMATTLVVSQAYAHRLTYMRAILYAALFTVPMILGEAKIYIFLVPIGLLLLYKDRIFKSPLKAIAMMLLVFMLLSVAFIAQSMLPGNKHQKYKSIDDYLSDAVSYNLGERGYGNGKLNRTTIYPFWWNENVGRGEYVKALLGNGLGISNTRSEVADAKNVKLYDRENIGLTSLSTMLWDIGIIGTLFGVAFLFMAYRLGDTLQKRWVGSIYWPYLRTAQISIVYVGINCFHNDYLVGGDLGTQVLAMIVIGYLLAMSRHKVEN